MDEERWIRASEIQAYGYCARARWLRYVLGLGPENQEVLDTGTERHLEHGRQVLRSQGLRWVAIALLIIALLFTALAVISFIGGP